MLFVPQDKAAEDRLIKEKELAPQLQSDACATNAARNPQRRSREGFGCAKGVMVIVVDKPIRGGKM